MIKNVLIIRFRRVGDSILSMALCHSLKLSFSGVRVDLVLNDVIAPLFEGHPDVDRVIAFSKAECQGRNYFRKVRQVMRATEYDAIIDMRATPKTLLFSVLAPKTRYRIGRGKWYNRGVLNFRLPRGLPGDMVERDLSFMDPLGREGELKKDREFRIYVGEEERASYRRYMESKGVDFGKPVVLACVATRIAEKAWDAGNMTEILRRILHDTNAQIVLNYIGKEEEACARGYYERLGENPRIFMDVEAPGLRQLCALCSLSDFFFGNEGGLRHLSQALGIPSYAIFPAGISIDTWLPGRCERYNGISADEEAVSEGLRRASYEERMKRITVDKVWGRLRSSLERYLYR